MVCGMACPGCFPSGNEHESNTALRQNEDPLNYLSDGSIHPYDVSVLIELSILSDYICEI